MFTAQLMISVNGFAVNATGNSRLELSTMVVVVTTAGHRVRLGAMLPAFGIRNVQLPRIGTNAHTQPYSGAHTCCSSCSCKKEDNNPCV